jgi:hypothetical protein
LSFSPLFGFGLGLADHYIAGVLVFGFAGTDYGPGWLPIHAYHPAALFSDLSQQVTKRIWFISAYVYGVLSSHLPTPLVLVTAAQK